MEKIGNYLIWGLAALHFVFMALEMGFWTTSIGRKIFGTTPELAEDTRILAANQGLYNGIIAAGLIVSTLIPHGQPFKVFMVMAVLVAGLYGGFSAIRGILLIQALPAAITLIFVLWPQPKPPVMLGTARVIEAVPIADPAFAGCDQGQVSSAKLTILAFACGPEHGHFRLVSNPKTKGFDIETVAEKAVSNRTVIRVFEKAPDAPIESVLSVIQDLSKGPNIKACAFEKAGKSQNERFDYYRLAPTGAVAKAWEDSQTNGGEMAPPCGSMGVDYAGDRYFFVMPDNPSLVIYADMGTEIQPFELESLRAKQ